MAAAGIFIMFDLRAPFVSTPDEFSVCIGIPGVANPDRAYAEYRDRPPSGVPTPRGGPLSARSAHGAQLVAEMLNGAADDLSPIEFRARTAATSLRAAPLPIPTHMSEQVSYPG